MSLILYYVLVLWSTFILTDAIKTVQPRYHIDILRSLNETNVIRVAASASFYFEGIHSHYSRDMVRGWDFFAHWLNTERGGLYFNGSNYTIMFDFIEDYSKREFVTKVYTSIVNDYDFFFAPYTSTLANAAADVTDPKGKFMIATSASNTLFFKDRASTFAALPPSLKYLDASFKALSSMGAKVVAVIRDTDYGACGSASASNVSATKNGMTLYRHYDVNPSSPSYAEDINRIIADLKNKSVETLVGCTYVPLCYHIVNESIHQNYNPRGIVITTCLYDSAFMDWAGKNARGLMMPTVWDKALDILDKYTGWTPAEFADKFYQFYSSYPSYYAANTFSSGEILMDAIEISHSINPLVIADTVRKNAFETIFANVTFDTNNQIVVDLVVVQAMQNLKNAIVLPNATAAIYPISSWVTKECEIATNDCSGHGRCDAEGICVCDNPYYGHVNTKSCDTYCNGVRDYDKYRGVYFCKVHTVFHIAVVTIAGTNSEEFRSLLNLTASLVNNKTDGFFDEGSDQVHLELHHDEWECSHSSGYDGLSALNDRLRGDLGATETALSAFITPDCSSASEGASSYGDRYTLPQISFGASSVTLSDKNNFPLFARSCPNDARQSEVLVELLYAVEVHIIMVISTSDNPYSSYMASMIINGYRKRGGLVLFHESYAAGDGSLNASFYDEMMDRLVSQNAASIVLTTTPYEANKIFDAVNRHDIINSDKYVWFGTSDWVNGDLTNVPLGSLGVSIFSLHDDMTVSSKFMDLWRSLDPTIYIDTDSNRSTLSSYSPFAVDAVVSIALALQDTIDSNYVGSASGMRQHTYQRLINDVYFEGVSGNLSLDANGDREQSHFRILNYQGARNWNVIATILSDSLYVNDAGLLWPDSATGVSHGSTFSVQYVPHCPAGEEPEQENGVYSCEYCKVGYYKPDVGNESCKECPEGANCDDVGIVVPCILPGYWRPVPVQGEEGNFAKWDIFRCDVSRRCLGGCDLSNSCSENVDPVSPVCGVCKEGYYGGGNSCQECPSNSSFFIAIEYILIVLAILLVLMALFALYCNFIHSITGVNILEKESNSTPERNTGTEIAPNARDQSLFNESFDSSSSYEKRSLSFKESLRDKVSHASRIFRGLKAHGLFVTVKLTVSFVQVLLGSLSQVDVDWSSTRPNFMFTVDLNIMNFVPVLSGCRSEESLPKPFTHILLILFLPAFFIASVIVVRQLILCIMRRNVPSLADTNGPELKKAMYDMTMKAIVWFCLFSFPILASGTLSFFDCRDMGVIGSFMREDYSVRCDSNASYSAFLFVAVVCLLLYPVGIPVFFYHLIRDREKDWARVGSQSLHSNFLPEWAYFEVFELFRKLLLTSVVAFVLPGTATQVMYLFLVDLAALLVLIACRPYASDPDDALSGILIITECSLFFILFLVLSDVSYTDNYSEVGLMDAGLSMLMVALFVFVPMNIAAKIPSSRSTIKDLNARVLQKMSKFGIRVTRVWKLDARSRYQVEMEALRESMDEMRHSAVFSKNEDGELSRQDLVAEGLPTFPCRDGMSSSRGADPVGKQTQKDFEMKEL